LPVCLSLLFISSGHQRILRRRWRRSFRREGGKMFPETAFGFVFRPSVRLWVRQEVLPSHGDPGGIFSAHENPQTEPSSVQAASRSYR
jgi:hypothetical protein